MIKIDQISRNLIQISWTAMPLPPLERDRVGLLNQMQLSLLCIGTSIGLNFHILSSDSSHILYYRNHNSCFSLYWSEQQPLVAWGYYHWVQIKAPLIHVEKLGFVLIYLLNWFIWCCAFTMWRDLSAPVLVGLDLVIIGSQLFRLIEF